MGSDVRSMGGALWAARGPLRAGRIRASANSRRAPRARRFMRQPPSMRVESYPARSERVYWTKDARAMCGGGVETKVRERPRTKVQFPGRPHDGLLTPM